jgi:hypothetical protein
MTEQVHAPRFEYEPHPRIATRRGHRPPKVRPEPAGGPMQRFNAKLGLRVTVVVGTMWAAYLFTILALVSLPSAISSGNSIIIVSWIAQTFLQLVLLPIIIVGQNQQAVAADKRAEQTYKDAEAILHECQELQRHLAAQDASLASIVGNLSRLPGAKGSG